MREMTAKWPDQQIEIKPVFLVLHHTGTNNDCSKYLASPGDGRQVSVHFHITRTGDVTRYKNLINLPGKSAAMASHAGESSYILDGKRYLGLNKYSVGIEMDGDGKTAFTPGQLEAMYRLGLEIMQVFNIPPEAVVGHKEISPGRKFDPSPMDMKAVRAEFRRRLTAALEPEWILALRRLYKKCEGDREATADLNLVRAEMKALTGR